MIYYVVETQSHADGTGASIVTTKTDRLEAESEFHRILASAAKSEVYKHGATILTEDAVQISRECYEHGVMDSVE